MLIKEQLKEIIYLIDEGDITQKIASTVLKYIVDYNSQESPWVIVKNLGLVDNGKTIKDDIFELDSQIFEEIDKIKPKLRECVIKDVKRITDPNNTPNYQNTDSYYEAIYKFRDGILDNIDKIYGDEMNSYAIARLVEGRMFLFIQKMFEGK